MGSLLLEVHMQRYIVVISSGVPKQR